MSAIVFTKIMDSDPNFRLIVGTMDGREDWTVCRLEGYLDNENTPQFLRDAKLLLLGNCKVMGLDLSELSYISSTGVGALSALTLEARQSGRFFFLTGIPERIGKVLNLLGFWDMFSIVPDLHSYDFSQHL